MSTYLRPSLRQLSPLQPHFSPQRRDKEKGAPLPQVKTREKEKEEWRVRVLAVKEGRALCKS
jgi:hypothetical protein